MRSGQARRQGGRNYPCAVGRITISFTSISAGCSIANAMARAIAFGSRGLSLAEEEIRPVVLRARASSSGPRVQRLARERRGHRVARPRGLIDRGSALPVRVAGRLLEGPARTQHNEHDESTETDRPPSPVHHRILLCETESSSLHTLENPDQCRRSYPRRPKELATTMPKGKAARTGCGRPHALVDGGGTGLNAPPESVSGLPSKNLRAGIGLRTSACDNAAISVMSSARTWCLARDCRGRRGKSMPGRASGNCAAPASRAAPGCSEPACRAQCARP
jgi:hypothetical protein